MGVIAKSEWRGGEQKKLEKLEFDMPTTSDRTDAREVEIEMSLGRPNASAALVALAPKLTTKRYCEVGGSKSSY